MHKINTQDSKERKFEEKVREKRSTVLIFTQLHLHFCFNQHQNLKVEFKRNIFIFFFHLKIFSSLLCSTLSSSSLSSRHKSSHRRCSVKKAVLKKIALFTGKHLQENTFHLQCFDFMSNTVWKICIILIITLSVKITIKICLLG